MTDIQATMRMMGVHHKMRHAFSSMRAKRWLSSLRPTLKRLLESPPNIGSSIDVCGHIKTVRRFKKVGFLDVGDGSTYKHLSVVCNDPNILNDLKVGQSINLQGTIKPSRGTQDFEVVVDNKAQLTIIGDVIDLYPIQKKEMTLQYLRNFPELRHRTMVVSSILRFRSLLEESMFKFFNSEDFIKVTPPIITGADSEGAGEQFEIQTINSKTIVEEGGPKEKLFFGKNTFLTVSTQLHLEALAPSLNRVWTLNPCFRAENSNTNRHLSEFWMLEAEISYVDQISQLTKFCERMIKWVTSDLMNNSGDILGSRYNAQQRDIMKERWNMILTPEWPNITYTEAIDIIRTQKDVNVRWGDAISTEHEKWLAGEIYKSPVFISQYPQSQKPFYMPQSQDGKTAECFDLIFPVIGELIGGSLREHNYNKLIQAMKSRDMKLNDMEWYLSTRLNGSVPHGGFGMGFERLIIFLSGIDNIKDVVAFPRYRGYCDC